MKFYTDQYQDYRGGINLHARQMYVCILDAAGKVCLSRNLECTPQALLSAVKPFRDDLVVAVECMFAWYWVADVCAREGIAFVLGHALFMGAIHGGKAKRQDRRPQDCRAAQRRDARQGLYLPPQMRSTRDLLRRRCHLVNKRSELITMSRTPSASTACPPFEDRLGQRCQREGLNRCRPKARPLASAKPN